MKTYKFKINGNHYNVSINSVEGRNASVTVNGTEYQVELDDAPVAVPVAPVATPVKVEHVQPSLSSIQSESKPVATGMGKSVTSPLPGVIISVKVNVGDEVKAGQEVAILEAMKMENSIEATNDGTVTAVHAVKGDSVLEGAPIVTIA